jgi:hypothetical protein
MSLCKVAFLMYNVACDVTEKAWHMNVLNCVSDAGKAILTKRIHFLLTNKPHKS